MLPFLRLQVILEALENIELPPLAGSSLCGAYMSFSRFSHRQNRRHKLGGIAGSMVFTGELNEFLPLFVAAEIFHLGKGTSFGLGAIKLEIQSPQSSVTF